MNEAIDSKEIPFIWTRWHIEQVCWYFIENPDKTTADGSTPFAWLNLEHANLTGANLYGANLTRANLYGANLTHANLYGANLERANLTRANLYGANLTHANLYGANLERANLYGANLERANLYGANLTDANLEHANLTGANLYGANLTDANLTGANLRGANMSASNLEHANLTRTNGTLSAIDYLEANFEKTADGYIAYKTFNNHHAPNPDWKIESGSVLTEVVNPNRGTSCGCGVNVAKRDWNDFGHGTLWKVLIRWYWLPGVVVPFHTDGKIRCERVELVEIVRE